MNVLPVENEARTPRVGAATVTCVDSPTPTGDEELGMESVSLEEWDLVISELRRFAGSREVTVEDGRARVDFGSAHVEVDRDGRVDTGMPLHEFESAAAVELVFDHEAGELHVRGEDVEYTFRRP